MELVRRLRGTNAEDDAQRPLPPQALDEGAGDVRVPADDKHALNGSECVSHAATPSLRDRSDCMTPFGSSRDWICRHSGRRGYIASRTSGRRRESFAR